MVAGRFLMILLAITLTACDALNPLSLLTEHPLAQTATYQDKRFNYEIDYPEDWLVSKSDYGTRLTSFDPDSLPPQYGEMLPPELTQIDIYPSSISDPAPLADWIARDVQTMPPLACVINDPVSFTLDRGGQAVEIIASSDMGGGFEAIHTKLDGRDFEFVSKGNEELIRNVVRSLRPITPSESGDHVETFENIRIGVQYYCAV